MPITEKQKENIINSIRTMKHLQQKSFIDYLPEEQRFIMLLIIYQKGNEGFCIETNGTASNPKTITKFRKVLL